MSAHGDQITFDQIYKIMIERFVDVNRKMQQGQRSCAHGEVKIY